MQPVREVYSLLMPVHGGRIIVPRAAVAEVMGYSKPKDRPEGAPAFLLGYVEWQNQRIPLVSFEAARGGDVPELGRRTRIAVVFGIAEHLKPNVFAVVTQGYPYLVRVNENVLHSEAMETEEPLVLARVRMANEKPFVPDLEKLELLIAEGLGITADSAEASPVEAVDELDALELGDEEDFGDALLDGDDIDTELPTFEAAEDDAHAAGALDAASTDDEDAESPALERDSNNEDALPDLGEVTAFGAETNYSAELNELSEALDGDATEDPDAASVDLEDVTSFGADTNYSSELDELSNALQGDSDDEQAPASDDDFAIDLSDLAIDDAEEGDADDVETFDIADLELDDEADKKATD